MDAETSTGDVELTAPPGQYRVESRSGVTDGAGGIEVVNDPNARYTLRLGTSVGTVTVRQST